jgi:hypothetical protein
MNNDQSFGILPRLIRLRDVPFYLGMDKNRVNREVRPYVPNIRIGKQGIAFDRIDLDAWADEYKSRNGVPAALSGRREQWETKERQVSPNVAESGTSISDVEERAFAKALELATNGRQRKSLRSDSRHYARRSFSAFGRTTRSELPRLGT